MSQDVSLMGATYQDVPAVLLPKDGGGTAQFTDVTDTTAIASDVASGKYFYTAAGVKTAGTSSGGGGSSRVVSGTFKGTDAQKGTAVEITIPYTGNGYPIAILIFPSEGAYYAGKTFYELVQRYVSDVFCAVKSESDTTPSYSGANSNDAMTVMNRYKNSATNNTGYSTGAGADTMVFNTGNAVATNTGVVRMKAKDKLWVFIANASYGFAAGIEYTYVVYYSS